MDTNYEIVGDSQFGGPVVSTLPFTTGKYIYVHNTGTGTSIGRELNQPVVTTIDAAIGMCRPNKNDIVVVLPGHTETVSAAAGIVADATGITIYGLGNGADKPTLTFDTATNASFDVTSDSVVIINILGVSGIDGLTKPFNVTGDNFYGDIEWRDASATVEAATAVRLDGSNNSELNLTYRGFTTGNALVSAVRLDGCANVKVNLDANGVCSTAWVEMVDAASTNVNVSGKTYTQGTTNYTKNVVDTITGSTWYAEINDASAGSKVLGSNVTAFADADVSSVASTIQSVKDYLDTGMASFPVGATPANGVSIAGALRATHTLAALVDQNLTGALGVVAYPVAASAANGVNIAQVLRYIEQSQIGSLANAGGTATLAAMIGDPANVSIVSRLAAIDAAVGGSAGLVTYPAAQPAGDGISVAEVVRYIQETQLGTIANTGGTATLGGVLGDVLNVSVATRLINAQLDLDQLGTLVNTAGTAELGAMLGDFANISLVTRLGVPVTSVSADIAAVKTEVDKIGVLVNTGGTATLAGILGDFANVTAVTKFANIQAEVDKFDGATLSVSPTVGSLANKLNISEGLTYRGSCDSGMIASTTSIVVPDLVGLGNDYFNNKYYLEVIKNSNAVGTMPEGFTRQITDYVSASGTFTVAAFPGNVEANDVVLIKHDSLAMLDSVTYDSTALTASANGSLMEVVKYVVGEVNRISAASLSVSPVAGSLGRFVASGGTALGTQLADSKSLVDALGTNGTTVTAAAGSVLGAVGTQFVVRKLLTSSNITQAGVDITGLVATGALLIKDIHINTDATGLATGTNFQITTNNTFGITTPIFEETVANLGANKTESLATGSVAAVTGGVLGVGKKLIAKSTVADCTGGGQMSIDIVFQRVLDGATVAAA